MLLRIDLDLEPISLDDVERAFREPLTEPYHGHGSMLLILRRGEIVKVITHACR